MAIKRVVPATKADAEAMDQGRKLGPKYVTMQPALNGELPAMTDGITGTDQQDAIWQAMLHGSTHMVTQAYAGTGKTFTKVRGLKLMHVSGKLPRYTTVAAFNRAIGEELKTKVPEGVRAGTLHSLGFSACRYADPDLKVDEDKMDRLLTDLMGEKLNKSDREAYFHILRLASLCKNTLAGEVWDEDGYWYYGVVPEVLDQLCFRYDIIIEDEKRFMVYDKVVEVLQLSLQDTETIDQDDMIWLPVVKKFRVFRSHLLIVDEVQDLNACQQELALKAGERILIVGDKWQSVYGFRGADVNSMQTMTTLLGNNQKGVKVFPLSKTRRCPKSHVAYIREKLAWMSDFEAMPDAPEGVLAVKPYDQMVAGLKSGDMVVCRTNAPLVRLAFECIRRRQRVQIQGRDIGKGFRRMIETHAKGSNEIKVLDGNFTKWVDDQLIKIGRTKGHAKREKMLGQFRDKVSAVRYFIVNNKTVNEALEHIDHLFSDRGQGDRDFVLLGTVHGLKGMEADTVWVLGPEEMPHPMAITDEDVQQEWNIWYVAHTRSKNTMWLVNLPKREKGEAFREE